MRREQAWALAFKGHLRYVRDDLKGAAPALQRALKISRQLCEYISINSALVQLGALAVAEGQFEVAAKLHGEALDLARRLRFPLGTADALMGLGDVALGQGNASKAAALYRDALQCLLHAGARRLLAAGIERVGGLCVVTGAMATVARLFGAADAHFEVTGGCMPRRSSRQRANDAKVARDALGAVNFQLLWDEGQTLELERALEHALQACEPERQPAVSDSVAGARVLSDRELEVLRVMASGASNRQIAEALTVGIRTVETHVGRILRKLDVDNRHEAMLWAREHHIADQSRIRT